MIEEWRPISGYEGLYEVSSYGRVKSLKRPFENNGGIQWTKERILSPGKSKLGYLIVNLCCNGKVCQNYVHRLVAQTFVPNPENLTEVNHKDEDKANNIVDNLEWCDHSYNINYGTRQERSINTKIKNGYVNWENVGLSRKEYMKKYYQENNDKIRNYKHQYYLKKKEYTQNNV